MRLNTRPASCSHCVRTFLHATVFTYTPAITHPVADLRRHPALTTQGACAIQAKAVVRHAYHDHHIHAAWNGFPRVLRCLPVCSSQERCLVVHTRVATAHDPVAHTRSSVSLYHLSVRPASAALSLSSGNPVHVSPVDHRAITMPALRDTSASRQPSATCFRSATAVHAGIALFVWNNIHEHRFFP
jgi:hypothetical protein